MSSKIDYKSSGVDIEKGDALVEKIKSKVDSTYNNRVKSGVGGFACLYEVGDRYLAAGTDGVGTKLKLAFELDRHDTVGIDLVAMCVNDILCTGAKPLFFMDYLATGKLSLEQSESILNGIIEGCKQSECALIGGETAEMPGMYQKGEYDLAGFAIGEVFPQGLLSYETAKEGMTIIGLPSNGFHSNGFSLVRKVCDSWSTDDKRSLLAPTKIYYKAIKEGLEKQLIKGMAHVTGGGLLNIPRMNGDLDYHLDFSCEEFREQFMPELMKRVEKEANLDFEDTARTFNCGIGLVMITDKKDELMKILELTGEKPVVLGATSKGSGKVTLKDLTLE